jgi:mannose-6-phosphate isomerase-like protein (cupin superfamily)
VSRAAFLGLLSLAACAASSEPAPAPTASQSGAIVGPETNFPVNGDAPDDAPFPTNLPTFEREHACAKACSGALFPGSIAPKIDEASPIWTWVERLDPGASLELPEDQDATVTLVGLPGAGTATLGDGHVLSLGGIVMQRGAGVTIRAGTSATVFLVAISLPSDAGTKSVGALAAEWKKGAAARAFPAKRRPVFPTIRKGEGHRVVARFRENRVRWEGGRFFAFLAVEDGAQAKSLTVDLAVTVTPTSSVTFLGIDVTAKVAPHVHDKEWEALVILQGEGTMKLGAEGKEKAEPVSAGRLVLIPAGVRHSFDPKGSKPLRAIQLYTPPGPEQRFKKLANP